MGKFLKIVLGTLLVIAVLAAVSVVLVIVFKDKIPIGVEVPKPEEYQAINRSRFIVATNGIEDAKNPTVVYESTGRELEQYGFELRYISGRIEPLVSVQDTSLSRDIPTDISEINVNTKASTSSQTSSSTAETPSTETTATVVSGDAGKTKE